ncbi:ABC-type sugar transport system substrate-binding protein [Microbacterium aurum]|nr:ABC-type sugar transport system substrate-binding protein [Microbacterium aurum]
MTPMVAGEKQAAEDLGVTVDVQNGQGDLAQQIAIIQQFVAQGKDALVVTTSDGVGIVPALQAAHEAGIPVIANNTVIEDDKVITYVGSDNVTFGKTMADAVCEELGGKGKIAVILGILGSSPQLDRQTGLNDGIKEKCPDVEILAEQTANWDNAQALTVGQDFLNRFGPGEIDMIVDQGPEGIAPAQWAHENGRDDVKWIVGDIPKAVAPGIESGLIDVAIWQDPYEQGYKSVEDAVNWLRGDKDKVPQPRDYSKNEIITKDDLGDIEPY